MNKLYTLLIISLLLFSCNETEKKANDISETTEKEIAITKTKDEVSSALPIVDYEGLKPYLEKNDETTYVVNFWATWCKPCIKELPYFEKIGAEYADKNVKILLVSLDNPKIIEKQVVPFIKKRNLQSEVIVFDDPDANGWIPKIAEEWSGAIPATIIYNKNDRKFYEKSFSYEELETEVQSIL